MGPTRPGHAQLFSWGGGGGESKREDALRSVSSCMKSHASHTVPLPSRLTSAWPWGRGEVGACLPACLLPSGGVRWGSDADHGALVTDPTGAGLPWRLDVDRASAPLMTAAA